MIAKVGYSTPMLHVAEIEKSIQCGELQLKDPDGYAVLLSHWGKAEQEAWEKRIGAKA